MRQRCRHSRISRRGSSIGRVRAVRMHALQCLGAAPLPMLDQIAEQLTSPADAAFEKGKAQFREAPGDAAQEDRLGGRMPGGGEMADVSRNVVFFKFEAY